MRQLTVKPDTPPPPRGGRRVRGGSTRSAGVWLTVGASFLALLLAGAVVWLVYGYGSIYPNVHVNGVLVGGLTREQASHLLSGMAETPRDIEVRAGEITRTLDSALVAHMVGDSSGFVSRAYAVGRTGGFFRRFFDVARTLMFGTKIVRPDIDRELASQAATSLADEINRSGTESSYRLLDDAVEVQRGLSALRVDAEELTETLIERLEAGNYDPIECDVSEVGGGLPDDFLSRLSDLVYQVPQNARFSGDPSDPFSVIPETVGRSIDMRQAVELLSNPGDDPICLPLILSHPDITAAELEEMLYRDVLAEVETNLNPRLLNRTNNVALAASKVNGKVLMPGEVFSYNETVGKRTVEAGYKDAQIYKAGEVIDDIGGGICQVSSTLYMAALRANLEIVERHYHQFLVAYTPIAQDATVYWGHLDFQFRNNTDYPIRIESVQYDDKMKVVFYGTKTDDITVEIESVTESFNRYETTTVVNPELAPGSSRVKSEGHSGAVGRVYRILKDADGAELSRELMNTSKYTLANRVLEIGPSAEVTPDPAISPPPAETSLPPVPVPSQGADVPSVAPVPEGTTEPLFYPDEIVPTEAPPATPPPWIYDESEPDWVHGG